VPSVSKKQHNFMAAVANNPAFAKKAGVPMSVGEDYIKADKSKSRPDRQVVNKPKTFHGKSSLFSKGGDTMAKKLFGGKETYGEELKEAKALKSGKISERGFARGEKSEGHKEEPSAKLARQIKSGKMSPTAYAKMESKEPKGMKAGGFTRSADGIAKKGKTKAMQIAMKRGGKC